MACNNETRLFFKLKTMKTEVIIRWLSATLPLIVPNLISLTKAKMHVTPLCGRFVRFIPEFWVRDPFNCTRCVAVCCLQQCVSQLRANTAACTEACDMSPHLSVCSESPLQRDNVPKQSMMPLLIL